MTGAHNSFVGEYAASSNTTGSGNTLVGSFADTIGFQSLTNATAIGYQSAVTQSNSLVLGSIHGLNSSNADTNVGIGTTSPVYRFSVVGSNFVGANQGVAEFESSSNDTGIRIKDTATNGRTWTLFSSGGTTGICQGCFTIYDATSGQSRITIDTTGAVTIPTLGAAGSTSLCRNASNQISTCSSSIRYKQNVNPFGSGLSLIKKLRPVSFNWRANNQADLGLVAEDVARVEPLLTTTNDKGEVEGVKYDRVGVVLINAVKEQQTQIEAQQKQIEILQKQVDGLKTLVCSQIPTAATCKR